MFKKTKYYTYRIIENNRIIGIIEIFLILGIIITAVLWFKHNKQELEPITVIFGALITLITVLRIIVKKTTAHKLTFSEYVSENKMEASFFMGVTFTDLKEAFDIARKERKGVFLVIYDNKHSTNSKINYSLGYFTQYEKTKRLINENFIQAIVSTESADVNKYIPTDYHMENCLLVVFSKELKIIRQEGVYANADEGLKRVREDIEKIEDV